MGCHHRSVNSQGFHSHERWPRTNTAETSKTSTLCLWNTTGLQRTQLHGPFGRKETQVWFSLPGSQAKILLVGDMLTLLR